MTLMWRLRSLYRASYSTLRGGYEPAPSAPSIPKLALLTRGLGLAGLGGLTALLYLDIRERRTIATPPTTSSPPPDPTRWETDIAQLNLRDDTQLVLKLSRQWLERGQPLLAIAAIQVVAKREATRGTDFFSLLGELICDGWIQSPSMLRNLAVLGATNLDSEGPAAAALLETTYKLLLNMMLGKVVQGAPAVPSLQWLAVASLCMPPLTKALTEKLAADLLETDLHKERADMLPILVDLGRPDLRILQLAVLRECLGHWPAQSAGGGSRIRLATCSLNLANKCLDDLIGERENDIGPKLTQRLLILHLHNTVLRLLPPEADARKPRTPSETRDAFAELHIQRAWLSEIFGDGMNAQHLLDALTWLDPTSSKYAAVKRAHDRVILRAIQSYRERHGKEIV